MADNSDLTMADFEGVPIVGVASAKYDSYESAGENFRFKLALDTIDAYQRHGMPLLVVDASTEPGFGDEMREHGAFVLPAPRPGLATQYLDGVKAVLGQGAERIVRHEPEKVKMVDFWPELQEALGAYDILVIGRTEKAMRSLPPTQAKTERMAGWLLEEFFDFPPDALSGGRGFTQRGAGYLLGYEDEKDRLGDVWNTWMHLYVPVLNAKRDGVPVGGIEVDLIHPPEMVAEETEDSGDLEHGAPFYDKKRYEQFFLQLDELLKEVGYEPGPESLSFRGPNA